MKALSYALATDEVLWLDGRGLTVEDVVAVARHRRRVDLAEGARRRVARCRAMVEVLLATGEKVYGLTTGFGKLRDVPIAAEQTAELQRNLIRSHACGVGRPLPEEVVRAALLLRINTLCQGHSGIRLSVLQQLVRMLNDDVYPYVPEQGSVGASGDLAPLSHLALVLMGDPAGRYFPRARRGGQTAPVREPREEDFAPLPADAAALAQVAQAEGWSFAPVELGAKEGLALNNGTQFMTALACLSIYDAYFTLGFAELAGALSLEAQRGVRGGYDARIHQARPHQYQAEVARRVLGYCEGSQILDLYLNSAHLWRARQIHLREARERLDDLKRELDLSGHELPASVGQVDREMAELRRRLDGLIPRGADGRADAAWVAAWRERPPREQIDGFKERLARVRQDAVALLQAAEQATFPQGLQGASTSKIRSALVEVIRQISQAVPDAPLVQDDYSFRCFPQVLACAYRALWHVYDIAIVEINAATDNPLLFPPDPGEDLDAEAYRAWLQADKERPAACAAGTIGGGNFHGEPIAIAMDYLAIAMAEAGSIAERRVAHLVDENLSRGLPAFLIEGSGLNSGFMIPQYTAAALVSENKVLCHPASVDSIPTCANAEDHVSMGTIAARKAARVIEHVAQIVAIELLTAYQGLKFRAPLLPGAPLQRVVEALRACGVADYDRDRAMYPDMHAVRRLMTDPRLLCCLNQG